MEGGSFLKRFTKHWIGWEISDRVIPEGDPGILGSVCAGVFGDPTNGGLGRGGKMERVALLPCGLSGSAVSGVHGFSAGDQAVCSSGIRG